MMQHLRLECLKSRVVFSSSPALVVLHNHSLCHLSVYRDSGQAHNQYSKETLSVTMLPVFLLVASLVIETGLSERRCLEYDVLCTTADYQFRRYNETVWLGTHVSNDMGAPNDLQRLYRYMWMEERKGMTVRNTSQGLVSCIGDRVVAIHVMLPEDRWDNPPTITDPKIFITRFPMMDVFARVIHGRVMTDASYFNRTLIDQNANADNSIYFVYGCQGVSTAFPLSMASQEIWFVATGGFDCPAP
ncbi:uncharacterized protein [Mobula birostris]|uniref:uncharacterized protein n=1 Tax=Mobula birostris TaxID=1983395 RepID=UPI003B288469